MAGSAPAGAHSGLNKLRLSAEREEVADVTFAECIEALNDFVFARCLRRYQSDILTTGELSIYSPFSGSPVSAIRSMLLPDGSVAYEFAAEENFWLLADNLAHGFPLSRIMLENDRTESTFPCASGLGHQAMTPELAALLTEVRMFAPAEPEQAPAAGLVIGHPNFAHHLWNELGGLDAWLAGTGAGCLSGVTIFAQFEPLGAIEQIFGILADADIRRGADTAEINRFPGLLTRIGSTIIPISLRRRTVAALAAVSGERAGALLSGLESAWPVFWLSIRPEGNLRRCVNELAFLDALSCSLMTAYPDCAILIDGFSLPADYHCSARYDALRPAFGRRLEFCTAVVGELCQMIEQHIGAAQLDRIHDVCGFSLADAVTTARRADYYVSHAGTLQHKLGWIHNTPGFVHSCQGGISPAARRWYAAQVEGGIEPDVIASGCIEDLEVDSGQAVVARNVDYLITDIPGAVTQVLRDICIRLRG